MQTVTIRQRDDEGGWRTRRFWAPLRGGYVREDLYEDPARDPQVCDYLDHRGPTLSCGPAGSSRDIETVIRAEARRASDRRRREARRLWPR